ncbi:MAG: hypothetical protein J6A01_12290 [Proteobacteria bacterium]|nr:hypothetical protein [Pseudomonadota bacterium]
MIGWRYTKAGITAIILMMSHYAHAQDDYLLSIDPHSGTIQVQANILDISCKETICLPAFGQRFGEHFLDPTVTQPQETIQSLNFDSAGCLSSLNEGTSLQFKYTLKMDALPTDRAWLASELSPFHSNEMLAFPGESLFIERGANNTPSRAQKTTIAVENGGQIVSTLAIHTSNENARFVENKEIPGDIQLFAATDRFELNRSFWTFGTPRILMASSEHMNIQIALAADWPITTIQREIAIILDEYARIIPEKTPKNLAVFCFDVPFDANYHHGFARPGGIILQMGKAAISQASTRRILMAHEIFHIYNGEGLRFSPNEYEKTAWFREGMTQYVALQTLLSLGMMTISQFNEWMSSSIERTLNAKKGDPIDVYHQGFFISLAFDQQWRLYQTQYSIIDFWRWIGTSSLWNRQHTNVTLLDALSEYSRFDFKNFFSQYIEGKTPLPVEQILKLSGLCIRNKKTWFFSAGMDYGFDSQNAKLYVKSLDPNGVGRQAGLSLGAQIVPETNTNWNDASDKRMTVIQKSQQKKLRIPTMSVSKTGVSVEKCM